MKLKSYFAGTVEAAMALAREELGPDAMLVHSKRTTPETRHIGQYEVVFALPQDETREQPERPAAPPTFKQIFGSGRESAIEKLTLELESLKKRIDSMTGAFAPPVVAAPQSAPSPRKSPALEILQDAGLDRLLAETIAKEVDAADDIGASLRQSLAGRVQVDPTLGVAGSSRRIVALVGPSGAGKTTTLVKLATRYGLTSRRSVQIITTDVFRVGGAEHLRLYASILGLSYQAVETPRALAQALEEQSRKDLIFIDTPALGGREVPEARELAEYIANDPDIDVHVVLPASCKGSDLSRAIDRYRIFKPDKLIFTRLDETDRCGSLINLCWETSKPLSFLTRGDQIPEDLEPASVSRILDTVLTNVMPPSLDREMAVEELN